MAGKVTVVVVVGGVMGVEAEVVVQVGGSGCGGGSGDNDE